MHPPPGPHSPVPPPEEAGGVRRGDGHAPLRPLCAPALAAMSKGCWQRPQAAGRGRGHGVQTLRGGGVTSAVLNCPFQGPACHPELGSGRVKGVLCDSPRDAAARGRTRLVAPCRGPPVVGAHPPPVPWVLGCFGAPLPGESGKSGLPPAPQHQGKPPRIALDGSHLGGCNTHTSTGAACSPHVPPPHLRAVYTHTHTHASPAHASVARTRVRFAAHVRAPCTELHARTCMHTLVRACPASTPLLCARCPVLQARCTASAARSSPPSSASALPRPQALPAAPWQRSWLACSLPRTRFNGRKALQRV